MYEIRMTKTFRKDTERCRKRGYDMELLKTAIRLLEANGQLPMTTTLTNFRDNMANAGNVTLNLIGS